MICHASSSVKISGINETIKEITLDGNNMDIVKTEIPISS
jgi:hypothetical protein